ncbi:MAG: YcnI family protein [Solirubrobacterales bacterium]
MTKNMKAAIAVAATILTAALLLPAAAQAHVTVQPTEVPAGSFSRVDVRVPNEEDGAATTKVEVEMPEGFIFASYEPVPGWNVKVKNEKLDEPVEAYGESYDAQVGTITWTAASDADGIQPSQFQDFGLSVGIPDQYTEGDVLSFPAIQTYSNGDVVRWIGEPDSEDPAAQVTLTAAAEDHHSDMSEDEHAEETATADEGGDDGDGAPTWLAVLGVVLGAVGIGVGGVALTKRK